MALLTTLDLLIGVRIPASQFDLQGIDPRLPFTGPSHNHETKRKRRSPQPA
jgi:hypothetical protein